MEIHSIDDAVHTKTIRSKTSTADLILFDPELSWCYLAPQSKASNSPWLGKTLKGKVLMTMCGGMVVYEDTRAFGSRRVPAGQKLDRIP